MNRKAFIVKWLANPQKQFNEQCRDKMLEDLDILITEELQKDGKEMINIQSLREIAIYLSGVKDGKGNILPLGTIVLDDLWETIKYLQNK